MSNRAPAPAPPDLTGALIAGRFHVVRQIGSGGYGQVYAAEQVSMGRRVALKVLSMDLAEDPRVVERFYREARQTSQLTHTNTVVCYDFGEDREQRVLYLAMEYLDGCSLLEVLERDGALSPVRTLGIVEQIAASLQEAHDRGMIHRDLKPANIMLINREGNSSFVKVIDFGIAMIFNQAHQEQAEGQARLTRSGMVMGTPHYMAPEQIKHQPLDHRVDVYALGVLTFEMLTGQRPFPGTTPIEIMRKHLEAPPPLAHVVEPSLPVGLSALLSWAMAKRAADRPQSVIELANAFRDALMQGEDNTARVGKTEARTLQHLLQAAYASGSTSKMSAQEVMAAMQASHQAQGAQGSEGERTTHLTAAEVAALTASQHALAPVGGEEGGEEPAGIEPTAQMTFADVQALMRQQQAVQAAQAAQGASEDPATNTTTDLQPVVDPLQGGVSGAMRPIPPTSQRLPVAQPKPPVAAPARQPSPKLVWAIIATALVGALVALVAASL